MPRQSINTAVDGRITTLANPEDDSIQSALTAAYALYQSEWSRGPIRPRLAVLARLADLMDERAEELALVLVNEMGKGILEARWEVNMSAEIARHYARTAGTFQTSKMIETPHGDTWMEYHPVGVVVAVEPWYSPYYQLIRAAAPNIAVGNPVLAKQASVVPQAAAVFEELVTAAGAPLGAWTNLSASGEQIGSLIADGRVQGVALTGSEKAGSIVATQAAKTHKKPVLELGGADVFAVLEDVDLEKAVEIGATARPTVRLLTPCSEIGRNPVPIARGTKTLDGRRLQRVFEYADANLAREITVGDLASTAALSRFHFSRMFKATTGYTPGQFISQRRLELAKALFAKGRSITEIAQECGFSSEANFGRSFRKATGVTPGRYRKLIRTSPCRAFPAPAPG